MGNEYFVQARGRVRVFVYKDGTDPKDPEIDSKIQFQRIMEQGGGFGELALLYNSKRTATIRAEDDEVDTYVLDGMIFKAIIIKSSIDKRSLQSTFLDKIKLFGKLTLIYL
jgi:cAMP-dependent protein kinase regulator